MTKRKLTLHFGTRYDYCFQPSEQTTSAVIFYGEKEMVSKDHIAAGSISLHDGFQLLAACREGLHKICFFKVYLHLAFGVKHHAFLLL